MLIGKIVEVRGIKILAKMDKKLPPHIIENGNIIPAPQINSYVKTRVGLDIIICQIVGEYLKFDNNETKEIAYLVELEVKGRISNGKFLGGLRLLPIVEAKIETLEKKDFEIIFYKPQESIKIGKNLFDNANDIALDINQLIPSHIGIFGNTGSGKSNTMSKILKEYIVKTEKLPQKNNSKILIFDLNNEYGENAICNEQKKKIFNLNTRKNSGSKIPFNFKDLSAEDWGIILNATEKTQMPIIRRAYENSKKEFDADNHRGLNLIKRIIYNKKNAMFYSIRNYAEQYFENIDRVKFNGRTGDFYYDIDNYNLKTMGDIDKLDIKVKPIQNSLDRFEFELLLEIVQRNENGINFEYISPLMFRMANKKLQLLKIFESSTEKIEDSIFEDKNICVIQLGNVNKEMKEVIPSLISNILYDNKTESKGNSEVKSILNIVIDEAHNLLSNNKEETEIHGNSLKTFEKIIKEGRKFGVYLMIASQRPSDISTTITSQLQNYFIHKLVNPNDIEKIRKTVAYMNEASLNMVTVLGPGECIISGNALYIPQYAYIDELDNEFKPNSANIKLVGDDGILE
ncbi:MAG: ATP-binding protein [Clostridia bacterium]|nr:ATP-binding protein [Clostridia bacterium]